MKNLIGVIILLLSFSTQAQSNIEGLWNTGENNTKIEISKKDSQWFGIVKSSDNDKGKIGKLLLKNLKKDGDKWVGKIYSAKRKDWYNVEIIAKDNILELKISVGSFRKSLEWKRSVE